ncbi:MAG: hypothetical protein AAF225_10300 [Pseudomonadota bacterium]
MILTKDRYPATIFALNVMRCDNGGPYWPPRDETLVPVRWEPFMGQIEEGLAGLDGGEHNDDLDGEMWTFCAGCAEDTRKLISFDTSREIANLFLNDFFDGWTLFGPQIEEPSA